MMRKRFRYIAILIFISMAWVGIDYYGLNRPVTRTANGQSILVRDGDTLRIGDADIRLYGIDAVEYHQMCKDIIGKDWACGKSARAALAALVKGHVITCEEKARDRYNRIVAQCRDERDDDISAALAREGMAISPGYELREGPYEAEVNEAKLAKRGIWAGSFLPPVDYRRQHPNRESFAVDS